jgi:hypothetical protein
MFDHTSRYYRLETATLTRSDGVTVAYVRRRFLPNAEDLPLLAEMAVNPGERLDVFTARTLGDPMQFWRVCDANTAVDPLALVEESGRLLRVPLPQP